MFLRDMTTFRVLRDAEGEGGAGGGDPMSALEARNKALEDRLNKTDGELAIFRRQAEASQQDQQVRAATARVEQAVADASSSVDIAERELRDAHDTGEATEIAAAQRKLSEAAAKRERVNAEADGFKRELQQQQERRTGGSAPAGNLDTKNLDSWKDRNNEWYGIDQDMTRASHEIDSSIRAAGQFKVGSEDYFKAIDRAMKQRFPDRFAGAPASGAARGEQAPGGTRPPRRYTESIQRGMEAFGMSAESWDAARQKAVDKGLLGATPATGRIRG